MKLLLCHTDSHTDQLGCAIAVIAFHLELKKNAKKENEGSVLSIIEYEMSRTTWLKTMRAIFESFVMSEKSKRTQGGRENDGKVLKTKCCCVIAQKCWSSSSSTDKNGITNSREICERSWNECSSTSWITWRERDSFLLTARNHINGDNVVDDGMLENLITFLAKCVDCNGRSTKIDCVKMRDV